ncbi:MAG TPA: hypothetical protein VND91_06925, partial [Candidatus Saccharimonadia bacterium]|nr:hypothetical protein [Candidatus Saccharimonadia bacterium]
MSFSPHLRAALVVVALACAATCSAASPAAGSPRPDGLKDAEWRSLEGAIAKATEEARLAVGSEPGADGAQGDNFGYSVAVAGNTALVGSYFDDVGASDEQGSVYVFVRNGASWSLQAKLVAADGGEYQYFGQAVALEGDTALIGTDGTPGAAYVFVRSGTSWSQQAKLTPSDGADTDWFGTAVALSGDTAIVGAAAHDFGTAVNQGSAYVFTRTGTSWNEQAKLVAANGTAGDRFGEAVAISGDSIVVGAAHDQASSGTAYVFVRSGSTWSEQAELDRLGGSASDDFFGRSVAISGETLAVGVLFDDVGGTTNQGSVRVYVRSGTTWAEQATLAASDPRSTALFGRAIALVGDTVVVGAPSTDATYVFTRSGTVWSEQARIAGGGCSGEAVALSGDTAVVGDGCTDVGGNDNQGVARVHVRSGTTWNTEAQLDAGNGSGDQELGVSVALSGDTALVGAPYDSASHYQQGAAFVFVRSGAAWILQARLLASDALARDAFGTAVALSGDTALIGAGLADVAANAEQGAAYVFVRSGATWNQQSKLVAADGTPNAFHGDAVALDCDTAIVGAPGATVAATPGQGAAYAFVRSGGTWTPQQKLAASDGAASSAFGATVALSGESALVGAPFATVGSNASQGAAYVFVRSTSTWAEQARLLAADGAASDNFGSAVALSGDTALAGASNDDVGANVDQGSAYAFVRSGASWSEQMRLVAPDGAGGDRLGVAAALAGNTALVGN